MLQTWAIAVPSVNNTAILANAVRNASGKYQLVLWRIRENSIVLRTPDPPNATGGKAADVHMVQVGTPFVSGTASANGELLPISDGNNLERLKDSAGQAGKVRALHLVGLSDRLVLTPCISASGRLLAIVWELLSDSSIGRRFDSGTDGPNAKSVVSALLKPDGSTQVAMLYSDEGSQLVPSTWQINSSLVEFLKDSANDIGEADAAQVVKTDTGHVVDECRPTDTGSVSKTMG